MKTILHEKRATRGFGFLENFLARRRAAMAGKLLASLSEKARILDVGCGSYPGLLLGADFSEKYGLDRAVSDDLMADLQKLNVKLARQDLEADHRLLFPDNFFDAVTMLAVIEHIAYQKSLAILKEIHRILKPHGRYVMTTPASWADPLLQVMSKFYLLSPEEVEEHQYTYTMPGMVKILEEAGFSRNKIRLGRFELGVNTWAVAVK